LKKIFHQKRFLFIFVTLVFIFPLFAIAADQNSLIVFRSSISQDIIDHEPVEMGTSFTNNIGKLYCFSEIHGATTKTHIKHVWYYHGVERARKQLRVHDVKWRTSSSKLIQCYESGNWEVHIIDADDNVLKIVKFNITHQ